MIQKTSLKRVTLYRGLKPFLVVLSISVLGVLGALQIYSSKIPVALAASNNNTVNFQARLQTSSGALVPDGYYNVEFKLYSSSSSSGSSQGSCSGDVDCLWVETRQNGTPDNRVRVVDGYLSVQLGSVSSFPSTINWNQPLWLSMNIGGPGSSPSWDGEMNPRIPLTAVPSSLSSLQLQSVVSGFQQVLQFASSFGQASTITIPDPGASTANVCLSTSINCGSIGSSSDVFINGGNSFGTTALLGTTDNFGLNIETHGNTVESLSNTGAVTFTTGNLQIQNAAGTSTVLTVDTSGSGNITVGNASNPSTITFVGGATASRPASPTKGQLYYDTSTNQLVQYNGTKWVGSQENAVLVAASNSSQADKDAADYVATGTDDGSTINTALNDADPAGSGKKSGMVYLFAGTYTLGATTIQVPNNTTLAGAGDGTDLTYPNSLGSGTYYAIENKDTSTGTHVSIQNLKIDGNKSNQSSGTFYGIYFNNMGSNSPRDGGKITDVVTDNMYNGDGIYFVYSSNNVISGSTANNNGVYGIYLYDNVYNNIISSSTASDNTSNGINFSYFASDNTVTGSTAQGNGGDGIGNGTGYDTVTGNTVQSNTGNGIDLGSNDTATGNTVQSNTGNGIYLYLANSATVTGNTVYGNSYGIWLETDSYDSISGNTVQGNNNIGIYLYGWDDNNTISANKVHDNGGSTTNEGINVSGISTQNSITNNDITDTSCTSSCYAIDITGSSAIGNYLSGNHFTGDGTHNATVHDATASGNTYSGQQLTQNGDASFRNGTNSTSALQIQTASGTSLFNVDTTQNLTSINGNATVNAVGSFPTTSVLDNFNRANGALGASWSGPSDGDTYSMTINSNAVTSGGAGYGDSSWATAIAGPNIETYATINTLPATNDSVGVSILSSPTVSLPTGYTIVVDNTSPTPTWYIKRVDASGSHVTLASTTQAVSAGDSMGLSRNGNQVIAWYKPSAGSWTPILTATDSTYTTSGYYIGLWSQDTTAQLDNFGGGTSTYGFGLTVNGNQLIQSAANSTTAFQIQNAVGNSIFNVDTSNNIVTVANSASGGEFINNGSTLNTALTLSNFSSSGALGTAAATVDNYTTFVIPQTTASITLTVPSPTDTTAGRIIYIVNTGTATLTLSVGTSITLPAGTNTSLLWNGTAWVSTAVSTGVSVVGGFDTTGEDTSANGATISGNTIYFQSATASQPGMVNTGTQTFGGAKTFQSTSSSALVVQTAGGSSTLLTADTSSMRVDVGTNGTATGQLYVSGKVPVVVGSTTTDINSPNAVAVSGNYAYIANTNSLSIIDISNPASPTAVGTVSSGISSALSIAVSGHYAYVASYSNDSLVVFDVSNPASPVEVGSFNTGSAVNSVAVSGRYAYVDSGTYLYVFDVSNPASPVEVGSDNIGTTLVSVAISGRYAYVNTSNTLYVIDVSNPANPTTKGNIGVSSPSHYITVVGNYVYTVNYATSSGTLNIVNVSNPSSPTSVSSTSISGGGAFSVAVQGRYAYIDDYWSNLLDVYDVSSLSSPQFVGSVSVNFDPTFVAVSGRYAYVTAVSSGNSLEVLDLGGEYAQQLQAGGTETGTLQVDSNANVGGDISIQGGLTVGSNTELNGNLGVAGSVMLQNTTNSTGAVQIANASGSVLLNADTTNSRLGLGQISAPVGTCGSNGGGAGSYICATAVSGGSLTASTTYYIKVTAIDAAGGESSTSAEINPATTSSNKKFNISWTAVTGAVSYRIYYSTTAGSEANYFTSTTNSYTLSTTTGNTAGSPPATGNAYTNQLAAAAGGTNYLTNTTVRTATNSTTAFQVQNATGTNVLTTDTTNSRVGVDVTYTAMSTPTGLSVTAAGSGSGSLIGTVGTTVYYYKVTAIDSAGGETTASTQASATLTSTKTMDLSWTAVTGASGYKVYRSTSSGTETYLTATLTNSLTDAGYVGVGTSVPPAVNTAYITTNNSNNELQVSVGGLGTPTGQLYVSGTQPKLVGSLATNVGGSFNDYLTAEQNGYAYLSANQNQLMVYNVSNPASPDWVADVGGGSNLSVFPQGNYIYTTSDYSSNGGTTGDLVIYDVSDHANPTWKSDLQTVDNDPVSIYVSGRYAYVVGQTTQKLYIFDISNPSNPIAVSNISIPNYNSGGSVQVVGHYAYVVNGFGNQLLVYDISNPSSPSLYGSVTLTSNGLFGFYIQGSYAYVASEDDSTIRIVDITDPSSPVQVGSVTDGDQGPLGIITQGRYAYVTGNGAYLDTFDISNPTNPVQISSVAMTSGATGLAVQGRYAYVTDSTSDLYTYDLGGTYTQTLQAGSTQVSSLQVDGNSNVSGDQNVQGGLNVVGSTALNGNLGVEGSALFQDPINSTTAFQIEDNSNNSILNVNTSTGQTTLNSTGVAFPTTPVLDTFTGTNGTAPPDANWTGPIWGDPSNLEINASNQATSAGGSGSAGADAWTTRLTSSNAEEYITEATPGDSTIQFFNSTGSSPSGYFLYYNITAHTLSLHRLDNPGNTDTSLVSVSLTLSANDSIGMRRVGSQLSMWYKPAGGSWTQEGTATDSTYDLSSGGGYYMGVEDGSGTTVYDNFGGGDDTNTEGNALTANGTALIQTTGNNSTTAFQVQNAAGSNIVQVDTTGGGQLMVDNIDTLGTGQGLNIGTATAGAVSVGNNASGEKDLIYGGTATGGGGIFIGNSTDTNIAIGQSSGVAALALAAGSGGLSLSTGTSTGNITLTTNNASSSIIAKSSTNSTTALQVQNASGNDILNIDTAAGHATIGNSATISSVQEWDGNGTNTSTLSISPSTVGDLMTLAVRISTTGYNVQSVSGGGVNWSSSAVKTISDGVEVELWYGTVTSTGAGTITVTYSGATGVNNELAAQEFTAGLGASTNWSITTSDTDDNTGSTNPAPFPSLTASQAGELYWGYMRTGTSGSASAGSTPGFNYILTGSNNAIAYDTDTANGTTYAPTVPQSPAGTSLSAGMIISASTGSALNVNGGATFTGLNSTSAFQVQDANGTSIMNVDTTNQRVSVGSIGTATGQLYVSGSIPSGVLAHLSTDSGPQTIATYGQYAYVGTGYGSIEVMDISDPSNPVNINSVTGLPSVGYLSISGKYLYALTTDGTLTAYSLDNPASPTSVGSVGLAAYPTYLYINGNYAYVTEGGSTSYLETFDISNPSSMALANQMTLTNAYEYPSQIAMSGNYLYIAAGNTDNVDIVSIANPAAPTIVHNITASYATGGVAVYGRYLYVVEDGAGLSGFTADPADSIDVYDITDPTSPSLTGTNLSLPNTAPYLMRLQGRYGYVEDAASNGFQAIDLSSPAAPQLVGTTSTDTTPDAFMVQGRYAYVAASGGNYLDVLDLGGEYAQQLQAGGTETGTLQVDTNANVGGDVSVGGGLSVGGSTNLQGNLGVAGVTILQGDTNIGNNFTSHLMSDDFESGSLYTNWTVTETGTSTVTDDTTHAHSGKYAMKLNDTGTGEAYLNADIVSTSTIKMRAYMYASSWTSGGTINVFDTTQDTSTTENALYLNSSGDLCEWTAAGTGTSVCSTTSMPTNQWVQLEFDLMVNATTGSFQVYVNGAAVTTWGGSNTSINTGNWQIGTIYAGDNGVGGNAMTYWLDDFVADENNVGTGSASLNVSDSLQVGGSATVGSLQVENAAGTQLLSVNNDGTNIQDASGNTSLNISGGSLDFNTYGGTTLGVNNYNSGLNSALAITEASGSYTGAALSVTGNSSNSNNLDLLDVYDAYNGNYNDVQVNYQGQTTLRNGTNSTTGFQIQSAGGSNLITGNTTNMQTTIGGSLLVGSDASLTDNFDTGSFASFWSTHTSGSSTITVDTAQHYSGSYAGKMALDGTTGDHASIYASVGVPGVGTQSVEESAYFYATSWAAHSTGLLDAPGWDLGNSTDNGLYVNSSGDLCEYTDGTGTSDCSTTALPTSTWFKLQFDINVDSTNGSFQAYLNGAPVTTWGSSNTGINTGNWPIEYVVIGQTFQNDNDNQTYWFDNFSGGSSNYSNSTSALQVQNVTGSTVLGVDTSNNQVVFGTAGQAGGSLVIEGATSGSVTIDTASTVSSYSLTLPDSGVNGAQCLQSAGTSTLTAVSLLWGNCGSGSGGSTSLQQAYTNSNGASPSIDMTGTLGGLTLQNDNADPITGELFGVHDKTASGLGATLFSIDSSGNLSVAGAIRPVTDSSTAIEIQNASGSSTLFTLDTTSGKVTIGSGGNTITLNPSGGITAAGTAQHQKTITLTPEYAGAVLDNGGSGSDVGTMTSGYDSTQRESYYNWTTVQTSAQTYDVVVTVGLPSDWSSWASSNALKLDTWSDNTSNSTGTITVTGTTGTVDISGSSITPGSASTWTPKNFNLTNGDYAADNVMVIRIHMSSNNGSNFRAGNLVLTYNSKF